MDAVIQRLPPNALPVLWFDNEADPMTVEFRSVMCALLAHQTSMKRFPLLEAQRRFQQGDRLFVMTREATGAELAIGVLQRAGVTAGIVTQDRISYGDRSFWIAQVQVLPASHS